jgi:hypothetical protein
MPQVLSRGIAQITGSTDQAPVPTFSWKPVTGAAEYVLTVESASNLSILWSWAGSVPTVTYDDSTIEGLPGGGNDGKAIPPGSGYRWSVLALDAKGRIIGAAFRLLGS